MIESVCVSFTTWQPIVPSWEKKFCTLVGSVLWRKLIETKRFMYLYDNVVQWNDSAGEEAFRNAKNRFWAEINGLPCDIILPDPDSYTDKIDWDSEIDSELLMDLEREHKVSNEKDKKGAVKENNMSSNWKTKDYENSWEHNNGNAKDTGYENCWNNSWEWNQRENNYNVWNNNKPSYADYRRSGDRRTRDVTRRKREGADQYMSRYKTTRFNG
ncbi:U4/U6 small nuclear ribonucleoprotein PRP4-like protein-like [Hibiscus syriacus]|uniref:U4/U6 small nuclear ribonucleoprotein PRP4-like protein-like n=1 Tax=Hibiscus syriacus TaxID=106335 RepID=A0A6A2XUK6_HIBSY|nr:U4/U6 small nuclear ribonucleoprotein PRP4-like protein-like [Hibiscus syriacus]